MRRASAGRRSSRMAVLVGGSWMIGPVRPTASVSPIGNRKGVLAVWSESRVRRGFAKGGIGDESVGRNGAGPLVAAPARTAFAAGREPAVDLACGIDVGYVASHDKTKALHTSNQGLDRDKFLRKAARYKYQPK